MLPGFSNTLLEIHAVFECLSILKNQQHGAELQSKKKNHNWSGIAGRQRGQQPMTGTDGRRVSRPGVPSCTKRLSEEIIVIVMNSAV